MMEYSESVAGIDIGSRSIELVVLNDRGVPEHQVRVPTTFEPMAQCERLMRQVRVERIVATGYGRKLFADSREEWGIATITEIQAYALGAKFLFPEARSVLDIGGQDTKVIALTPAGKVSKFEMNDRCAAGTGKFLEFMATALQVPLEEFGQFALQSDKRIQINSMCTVFAESEATSLMARGENAQNIAMGLHLAIAQRTLAMLRRVGMEPPLIFAGGVAHNACIRKILEEQMDQPLMIPRNPDMVGALGAALYARNMFPRSELRLKAV
jgi:predicted CoA-substrate-specific enzyme activase